MRTSMGRPKRARRSRRSATEGSGFLIIPIGAYLAWERRRRLSALTAEPSLIGLVVMAVSLPALLTGIFGSELFLSMRGWPRP